MFQLINKKIVSIVFLVGFIFKSLIAQNQNLDNNIFSDKQINKVLKDIMKEYNSKNVFYALLNLKTNEFVNQVSLYSSGEKRNLESTVLSYKLISPVIAYSLFREFNIDTSYRLHSDGSYKLTKATLDSIKVWSELYSNNKKNEIQEIYQDMSVNKEDSYSLQDALLNNKFSIIYKAIDTSMNMSLYSSIKKNGINNPFLKKQKIKDIINSYRYIYNDNKYLNDSFNSNFAKKLFKQNKYKNIYGIFSTIKKENTKFESSFVGYFNKSNTPYLIFIVVDVSTQNNVVFYSTMILDKMLRLFDQKL